MKVECSRKTPRKRPTNPDDPEPVPKKIPPVDADKQLKAKRVVDKVSAWLRVLDDGSVDRTWIGPPEALFLMEPVAPYDSPRDGVTLHDLPGNPSLHSQKALPILLHFHGGGFCNTHASWLMYHQFYSRLARTVPAVVISVELPLAPENRLPAAIDASFAPLHSPSTTASAKGSDRPGGAPPRRRRLLPGVPYRGQLRRELGAPGGGSFGPVGGRGSGVLVTAQGGGRDPAPAGLRPVEPEPVRTRSPAGLGFLQPGHAGQVPGPGAAEGGDQGPSLHVPDGGGGAAAGRC